MPLSNVLLNQYLGLVPAKYWRRAKDPFVNEVSIVGTLSVAVQAQLNIDNDSVFLCYGIAGTCFATDNTTIVPAPPFTIDVRDAATGRSWESQPTHWMNWVGTAEFPFVLIKPKLIGGGSVLTITATNLSATTRNLRLAFHGIKIFDYPEE